MKNRSINELIKSFVPEPVKSQIKEFISREKYTMIDERVDLDKRLIFVFLAGFYQNLGDMAITYAQLLFLQKCWTNAVVLPISSHETYRAVKEIKKCIKPGDIVTLIGGGNMSDRYQSLEDCRLHVVKSFPHNKIISFPQTIDYKNKKALSRSRAVYTSHRDLTVFAREPASQERARKYFPGLRIFLCPDIALSIEPPRTGAKRINVLCCLRSDSEQFISSADRKRIVSELKSAYGDVILKDTVDISIEECQPETYTETLKRFWSLVQSCKLVVTDRLHCMIFCVITGTPCVALDNTNHKISGIYNAWLKEVPFVEMCETTQEVMRVCEELLSTPQTQNDISFSNMFDALRGAVIDV